MNIITTGPLSGLRISLMGYNYDWLTSVFLSSYNVSFPSLTAINRFTNVRRVSAICPTFSGYEISTYSVINKNYLSLSADTSLWIGSGFIDVVFLGAAGYTKLSDKNTLILVGKYE